MATRPVKVLPDLLTQKQIIKVDSNGNTLFNVSGTLNEGHVSSSLPISASAGIYLVLKTSTDEQFYNVNIPTSSYNSYKVYNVDEAFHAVDTALGGTNVPTIQNAYRALRYQVTGNFNINGNADISLPLTQYGNNSFPTSSIDFINVSVMIKENGSWFNDIVAVNITSSAGQIHVIIDAPALNSSNEYRMIAVNDNIQDYVL